MERTNTQITLTVKLHNSDGSHAEKSVTQEYYAGDIPSADLEAIAAREVNGLGVGMTVLREQWQRTQAPHLVNRKSRRAAKAETR